MRQRIESEIEDTGPYTTVVGVLVAEASKRVTEHLVKKVTAALVAAHGVGEYAVRITRFAGMTSIEWGGYSRSQGHQGHSILIGYTVKSEPIAERHLDDMRRYLAAKHERNEQRRKILATDVPERIDNARASIAAAIREIDAIHDEGENYAVLPNANIVIEDLR